MLSVDHFMYGFSIWFPLLLLFSSLLLLKTKIIKLPQHQKKQIPPGPPSLPLLGHLHLLGSLPHRSLLKLSRKYGPIMLLKLGCVPTIVISSADAAKQVLKVHDLDCCSRPLLVGNGRLSYNYLDISFSPYGDHWREIRKICVLELFSIRRVQSFRVTREEEINLLINSIMSQSQSSSSSSVDLSEKSYSLTTRIISKVAFGKIFTRSEFDNANFQEVVRRGLIVSGSFTASDFFPYIGWIVDRLTGFHGRLERSFKELDTFFQHVIDDRINHGTQITSQNEENVVDVLLKMERDQTEFDALQLTKDCIKAVIMDIFLAGVDTGAVTIVWAMTELVRNPRVMKKLKEEIRSCIKEDKVKEIELHKLPYLKMVVKEVLRLHTPAPLLLPRETISHFELNGYDIDPKTHVHVNVWAIGRDPDCWKNPEEFFPERFMGSSIDYKGQNFEFLPFGAGRRSCPGMNMAVITVELALANLLLCFDWKLPQGMKEQDIDMEEEAGLTVSKKTLLQLVPVPV